MKNWLKSLSTSIQSKFLIFINILIDNSVWCLLVKPSWYWLSRIPKNLLRKPYCVKCINTDVEMQRLQRRLQFLENKVDDQKAEMRSLLRRVQYYKTFMPASGLPRTEKCTICNEKLSLDELYAHLCNKDESLIKCQYCSRTFKATIKLVEHLEVFHDDKTFYECEQCLRTFEMHDFLEIHKNTHADREPKFPCDKCDQKFYLQTRLNQHKQSDHPEPKQDPVLKRKTILILAILRA